MGKSLGGSLFAYNAIEQDYCIKEVIECLKALCHEVVLLDAGSTDETGELMQEYEDEKTKIIRLPNSEWEKMRGREKLAHFTNMATMALSTDWYFNLQADEIIHEDCFPAIREAIKKDNEAYFVERINLWGNSQHRLNVPHNRTPVGTQIIRLAKIKYWSVNDAEGIYAPASWDYFDKIKIWHMGFVRNKYIHTKKIEHMLLKVFGHNVLDQKIIEMDGVFDPFKNFSKEDLVKISEPLPIFVQKWAQERDEINQIEI